MATTIRPTLADSYFDYEAEGRTQSPPSIGSIVAVAQTSNWGPTNVATECDSEDEFLATYGGSDTDLYRAVRDAFRGQGVAGKGGAGSVLVYRQATSAAAKGTKVLNNTTPAAAITLTAKYNGTRANALRITTQAGTAPSTTDILVLDGALVVEKYTAASTDIVGLVAQINATSQWFTAVAGVTSVALALVSASAVTGGVDGETLTGTEWTATFAALDRERWQGFAAYKLTDPTLTASMVAWIKGRNLLGQRSWAVVGGAVAESMSAATTRSQGINDWDVINLGRGTLHLTDDNRDVSTSEFVARYAGARAWRGEGRDDIFVRFANVEIVDGPTLAEQQSALDTGVVVFSRDTNVTAPVFIREAVNTYADDSQSPVDSNGNKLKPKALWRRVKNIAIQQGIELEVQEWARSGDILGELPVNEKTRAIVLGRVKIAYQTRESAQIVQPGWTVADAAGETDDDDFVGYVHGFHPTRSLRQIFNQARVG